MRDELKLLTKLSAMNLTDGLRDGLKKAAYQLSIAGASSGGNGPPDMKSIIRVDVSKGGKHVVNFVNNLEKDAMYKRWPKKLKQLTFPSW